MRTLTRRGLLGAGIAALGVRFEPIRFALAPDVGPELGDGVRFGLTEAARATLLLGRRLELVTRASSVIHRDADVEAGGVRFSLRPEPRAYDDALEAARAAGRLPARPRAVEWHHTLGRYGASELNERFTRQTGVPMSPEHWLGWIAVKIIAEGSLRAGAGEALSEVLARARFDGHKGVALAFTAGTRRLRQPLYVVDTARDAVVWPA